MISDTVARWLGLVTSMRDSKFLQSGGGIAGQYHSLERIAIHVHRMNYIPVLRYPGYSTTPRLILAWRAGIL